MIEFKEMEKKRLEVFSDQDVWRCRYVNPMGSTTFNSTYLSRAEAVAAAVRHAKEQWQNQKESYEIYYQSEGRFVLHPHSFGHIV